MPDRIRKMGPRRTEELDTGRSKRLVIGVSVALVVCMVLVIGLVIAGGGDDKSSSIKAQATGTAQPATAPTTAAETSGIEQVEVPPLSVYLRRNPFKPLVNMEEQTLPTVTDTTGTGPAGGTVTIPPELVSGSSNPGDVVSTATLLEAVYEQDGRTLARLRIADQVFDGVTVGDVFGQHYKLLALGADSSATILYGDERMKLYTGQSIYW